MLSFVLADSIILMSQQLRGPPVSVSPDLGYEEYMLCLVFQVSTENQTPSSHVASTFTHLVSSPALGVMFTVHRAS